MRAQRGYILPLTLMILSLIVIATTYLFDVVVSYDALMHTISEREQAKMVALGGLQLAIRQLTVIEKSQQGAAASPAAGQSAVPKKPMEQQLLEQVLPMINRWQTFALTQTQEGVEGTVRICITAQEGKFNLAQLYQLTKSGKEGVTKLKEFLEPVFKAMGAFVKGKEMIGNALIDALAKRKVPFDDVTQLHELPEFATIPFFYEPPEQNSSGKRNIYLMDLFALETNSDHLEPWLLSDSVCALLGLTRATAADPAKRKEEVKKVLEKFKPGQAWDKQTWDTFLKPLYGKDFASLPKGIGALFTAKFEPQLFSVISYGKVGNTVQRIYAIVARSGMQNGVYNYVIRKLYWL